MNPPPKKEKLDFAQFGTFPIFFPSKWLIMTRNSQFRLIHNFSQFSPTEVPQNDSEWPILPDSQLFQSFPTKVAQNESEWPILLNSQLFQSFPTEVAQNDL